MRKIFYLSLFIVLLLIVPAVHATPSENVNYTPRIGKTLTYSGVIKGIYTNSTGTYNITIIADFNATVITYIEVAKEASYAVHYFGAATILVNGTPIGIEPIDKTVESGNDASVGVFVEENMQFIAINVSHIPEALYAYTLILGPQNFTATLDEYENMPTLTVNAYISDLEEVKYGEIHLTYLLTYGIVLDQYMYLVPEHDYDLRIFPMGSSEGEFKYVEVHYELIAYPDMTPIEPKLDVPDERTGMHAKRKVTNGTDTAYASIDVNEIVVVGEVILIESDISIISQTNLGLTRTSTFGRLPTPDDPRVMPPVLIYPDYLDEVAQEYNATEDTFTVNGETYDVYVANVDNATVAFIKDLGVLAYAMGENGSITLVELNVPAESEEPSGGEESSSGGSTLGVNTLTLIILSVVVLVLALLALFLRKS